MTGRGRARRARRKRGNVITNSTPHRTFVLVLSIIVSSLFYEIQINPAIASSLLSFISTEALGPFRCGFMA